MMSLKLMYNLTTTSSYSNWFKHYDISIRFQLISVIGALKAEFTTLNLWQIHGITKTDVFCSKVANPRFDFTIIIDALSVHTASMFLYDILYSFTKESELSKIPSEQRIVESNFSNFGSAITQYKLSGWTYFTTNVIDFIEPFGASFHPPEQRTWSLWEFFTRTKYIPNYIRNYLRSCGHELNYCRRGDAIAEGYEILIDQLGPMSANILYQPPKKRFHPKDDEDDWTSDWA